MFSTVEFDEELQKFQLESEIKRDWLLQCSPIAGHEMHHLCNLSAKEPKEGYTENRTWLVLSLLSFFGHHYQEK